METIEAKVTEMNANKTKLRIVGVLALAISLANFVYSPDTQAGTKDGGGGKGVVCRHKDGTLKGSVRVLDLWEAEWVHRLTIPRTQEPVDVQVERAIRKITTLNEWGFMGSLTDIDNKFYVGKEYFYYTLMKMVPQFLQRNLYTNVSWREGVILELTPDSYERMRPRHCDIEQLVRYEDDLQSVEIDADLVDKMGPTDFAALVVHEVFYKFLREQGRNLPELHSLRTRRVVGLAFAGQEFTTVESTLPKDKSKYITCGAIGAATKIYIHPERENRDKCYNARASSVLGRPVLGYKTSMTASCPIRDFDAKDDDGRYYSAEDLKRMGQFPQKVTHELNFLGKLAVKAGVYSLPEEPKLEKGAYQLERGIHFRLEPGAIADFDENGTLAKPMSVTIYGSTQGLKAKVTQDDKVLEDGLVCY